MEAFSVCPVRTDAEIQSLAALAKEIWEEHFTPIIGAAQVAYMLEQFQSYPALKQAVGTGGYRYWFLCRDGEIAGYTGVHPENGALFLSKLYLKKAERGKGLARQAFDFLCGFARQEGCRKIWLTCNRDNRASYEIYLHLGFSVAREQDADIGNGFVMNDYVMEYPLGG